LLISAGSPSGSGSWPGIAAAVAGRNSSVATRATTINNRDLNRWLFNIAVFLFNWCGTG